MPVLPEFTAAQGRQAANSVELRPSEIGIEALQQGARNISRLTQEEASMTRQAGASWDRAFREIDTGLTDVGRAVTQHQTQDEISSMGPAFSQAQLGLSGLYQDAMLRHAAGDPNALSDFNSTLDDTVANFQANANTPAARAHAQVLGDHLRQQFTAMQIHDQGMASGRKAVSDFGTTVNNLTTSSINDPALLDFNLDALKTHVGALAQSHQLSPETTADLTSSVTQTAAAHMVASTIDQVTNGDPAKGIEPNVPAARSMLDRYGSYLSEDQKGLLQQHIDLSDQAHKTDAAAAGNMAEQQAVQQSAAASVNHFNTLTDAINNQQPIPTRFASQVVRDPTLTIDDQKALIGVYRQIQAGAPPPKTELGTMDHLIGRLASVNDRPSPADIFNQVQNGRLSYQDASWLAAQTQGPPSPMLQQLNTNLAEAKIGMLTDRGSGLLNPSGIQAYQKFQEYAVNVYRNGGAIDPKQLPDIMAQYQPEPVAEGPRGRRRPLAEIMGTGSVSATNLANNNFGNIKVPGSNTEYQKFASAEEGVNAIGNQLQRYAEAGLNTIAGMINRYAPPSENNTPELIKQAAGHLGVNPNEPINPAEPKMRKLLIQSIILQEHSHIPPAAAAVLNRMG